MKTYPTRHPNWIDATDDSQPAKKAWTERIGISFPVAFAIVLALHLTVLGGIYASSKIKLRPATQPLTAKAEEAPKGPLSDAFVARNDWPQASATPEVKVLPPLPKNVPPPAKVASKESNKIKPLLARSAEKKIQVTKPVQQLAHIPSSVSPKPAPVTKPTNSALRAQFLATQTGSLPASPAIETRQAIPARPSAQPIVATNSDAIAPTSPTTAGSSNPTRQPDKAASTAAEYVLNGGDNLYSVSRRLQVPYNDLMEANGITDPRQLRVGQKLKVPERKSDI